MEQFGQSVQPDMSSGPNGAKKPSWGPVIGAIIIVVVIIIGGLYIWGGVIKKNADEALEPAEETAAIATELEGADAAEISDLEADIESLDSDLEF